MASLFMIIYYIQKSNKVKHQENHARCGKMRERNAEKLRLMVKTSLRAVASQPAAHLVELTSE